MIVERHMYTSYVNPSALRLGTFNVFQFCRCRVQVVADYKANYSELQRIIGKRQLQNRSHALRQRFYNYGAAADLQATANYNTEGLPERMAMRPRLC